MINLSDVNWISITIAAIVNMVIGGLWYSPVLFGDLNLFSLTSIKANGF